MRQDSDLTIELRLLYHRAIPATILTTALDLIQQQIYEVEALSLNTAAALYPNIPSTRVQDIANRLRAGQRRMLFLVHVTPGSVVMTGIVCAVGVWLLNQTLGETAKEAWRRDPLHAKLVDFLSRERPRRLRELRDRCDGELARAAKQLGVEDIDFTFKVDTIEKHNRLRVTLRYRAKSRRRGPTRTRLGPQQRSHKRRSFDTGVELDDI